MRRTKFSGILRSPNLGQTTRPSCEHNCSSRAQSKIKTTKVKMNTRSCRRAEKLLNIQVTVIPIVIVALGKSLKDW